MAKLILIGYCGKKESQDDNNVAGTNKVWIKAEGTVHKVTEAQAALLLQHTDSWEKVGEEEIPETVRPETEPEPVKKESEELFANVNLQAMNKTALVDYAIRTFNVTLDKEANTQKALVQKIAQLQKQHTGVE